LLCARLKRRVMHTKWPVLGYSWIVHLEKLAESVGHANTVYLYIAFLLGSTLAVVIFFGPKKDGKKKKKGQKSIKGN